MTDQDRFLLASPAFSHTAPFLSESGHLQPLPDLLVAADRGDIARIDALISSGVSPFVTCSQGRNALWFACCRGHVAVVEYLLQCTFADVDEPDVFGITPFLAALLHSRTAVVRFLLKRRRNFANDLSNTGVHPVLLASLATDRECFAVFARHVNDWRATDLEGRTAMYMCCYSGRIEIANVIIDRLTELSRRDLIKYLLTTPNNKGRTPLWVAASRGHTLILEWLIHKFTDQLFLSQIDIASIINQPDDRGATPFYIACESGHLSSIQWLLNRLANPYLTPENTLSPLCRACYEGYFHIVKFLCLRGVKSSPQIEQQCLNLSLNQSNVFLTNWLLDTRGLYSRLDYAHFLTIAQIQDLIIHGANIYLSPVANQILSSTANDKLRLIKHASQVWSPFNHFLFDHESRTLAIIIQLCARRLVIIPREIWIIHIIPFAVTRNMNPDIIHHH